MKLSFFVYFKGCIEFFDGFLLYFPLQRDIVFRLWHAKINQAFCWFYYLFFFSLSIENIIKVITPNLEYLKLDRDKSTFKSHRDFDSEIEMTFKHF